MDFAGIKLSNLVTVTTFITILTISHLTNCQKIGIIGAGVGGASTAYFLKQQSAQYDVHVFEKTSHVGGRLKSKEINSNRYDVGGSILHSRNKYSADLSETLDLYERFTFGGRLMIKNGENVTFYESQLFILDLLSLWKEYGLDLIRMKVLVNSMLKDFENIYFLQKMGRTYDTLGQLLRAMNVDFVNATAMPFRKFLHLNSFSDHIIDELIQPINLVNYGQTVDGLHGFVGSVSLAGSGSSLWAVHGGNERLPQKLLNTSNAELHLETTVTEIKLLSDGKYLVYTDSNPSGTVMDAVVIASPISQDIKFKDFPSEVLETVQIFKSIPYHRTVVTLVYGRLRDSFSNGFESIIHSNPGSRIISISRLEPVTGPDLTGEELAVFKIFSPRPLGQQDYEHLFEEVLHQDITDWLAYPEYSPLTSDAIDQFKFSLHPGLFYVNCIEISASAIEMSLIGGKNAALLTEKFLKRRRNHPEFPG